MSDEGPLPFMEVWDSSFFYALSYCFLMLGICCQFKFQLWTLDWRYFGSNLWRIVSQGYKFFFKFILSPTLQDYQTTVYVGQYEGFVSVHGVLLTQ